jgi:hypothetical protein
VPASRLSVERAIMMPVSVEVDLMMCLIFRRKHQVAENKILIFAA